MRPHRKDPRRVGGQAIPLAGGRSGLALRCPGPLRRNAPDEPLEPGRREAAASGRASRTKGGAGLERPSGIDRRAASCASGPGSSEPYAAFYITVHDGPGRWARHTDPVVVGGPAPARPTLISWVEADHAQGNASKGRALRAASADCRFATLRVDDVHRHSPSRRARAMPAIPVAIRLVVMAAVGSAVLACQPAGLGHPRATR